MITRVVTGAVGRTGGSNRKNMSNDIDAQMNKDDEALRDARAAVSADPLSLRRLH